MQIKDAIINIPTQGAPKRLTRLSIGKVCFCSAIPCNMRGSAAKIVLAVLKVAASAMTVAIIKPDFPNTATAYST